MNGKQNSLTQNTWMRLSMAVGLAAGLVLTLLLLPIAMTASQTASEGVSLTPSDSTTGQVNWQLADLGLMPFETDSALAVGGAVGGLNFNISKSALITTASTASPTVEQGNNSLRTGGLLEDVGSSEAGTVRYTVYFTPSANTVNSSVVVTDVLPTGLQCADTGNASSQWFHNDTGCRNTNVAVWTTFPNASGNLVAGQVYSFSVTAIPSGFANSGTITNPSLRVNYNGAETTVTGSDIEAPVQVKAPVLSIGKTSNVSSVKAGGTVNYTLNITNSGSMTLYANAPITIVDVAPEGVFSDISSISDSGTKMQNGNAFTITWLYTPGTDVAPNGTIGSLTYQATVLTNPTNLFAYDTFSNSATVSGGENTETNASASDTAVVEYFPSGISVTLEINKVITYNGQLYQPDEIVYVGPGERLTYQVTITNTGWGDAQVAITDVLPTAGLNLVDVIYDGKASNRPTLTSNGFTATAVITNNQKTGARTNLLSRFYQLVVTAPTTISAGDLYTNTVVAADLGGSGAITNNFTTNTLPNRVQVVATGLALTKTVSVISTPFGSTYNYTFTVANTGTVELSNVVVTDPFLNGPVFTVTTLAAGAFQNSGPQSFTLNNVSYISNGFVTNVATATGSISPTSLVTLGFASTVTATDSVSVEVESIDALTITKRVAATQDNNTYVSELTVGDVITYTYTLTNQSAKNVRINTLQDVFGITDTLTSTIVQAVENVTISAYDTQVFTYAHTLGLQEIVDALTKTIANVGTLTNTAEADVTFFGAPDTNGFFTATATVQVSLVVTDVVITKTASQATTMVNDTANPLTYTVQVWNRGSLPVVVPAAWLSDSVSSSSSSIFNSSDVTIAAGESHVFTETQSVHTGDVINPTAFFQNRVTNTLSAVITNTAVVSARLESSVSALPTVTTLLQNISQINASNVIFPASSVGGNTITDTAITTVRITPTVAITKSQGIVGGSLTTNDVITADIGNQLAYEVSIVNTGFTDQAKGITLRFTMTDVLNPLSLQATGTITTLPNIPLVSSLPYEFRLSPNTNAIDVTLLNSDVVNTASVQAFVYDSVNGYLLDSTGAILGGSPIVATDVVTAQVRRVLDGLVITKTTKVGGVAGQTTAVFGDIISYDFTVQNGSSEQINNVVITDTALHLSATANPIQVSGAFDVPAGGSVVTDTDNTLTNVDFTVDTRLFSRVIQGNLNKGLTSTITSPNTALLVHSNVITAAGVSSVTNQAVSSAQVSTATVSLNFTNDIDVAKTSSYVSGTPIKPGESVVYTVSVTSPGDVQHHRLEINDVNSLNVTQPITAIEQPVLPYIFGTNATQVVTYTYLPSAVEIGNALNNNGGKITNTVTAIAYPVLHEQFTDTATSLGLGPVTATVQHVIEVSSTSRIQVMKVASVQTATLGDTITYTYYVTNTGENEFDGLTLVDDKLGSVPVTLPSGVLTVGGVVTATASHTVVVADYQGSHYTAMSPIGSGTLSNTVVATATNTQGFNAAASDDASVTLTATHAALEIVKTVSGSPPVQMGGMVTYTVMITNPGTFSATVTPTDQLEGGTTPTYFPAGSITIAAGASETRMYTHTVSVLDLSVAERVSGTHTLSNQASASGVDAVGYTSNTVTATASISVQLTSDLTLRKWAYTTSTIEYVQINQSVTYYVMVTNTGTTSVTFSLTDTYEAPSGFSRPAESITDSYTLGPNGMYTFTHVTYITQPMDIPAITNTVIAYVNGVEAGSSLPVVVAITATPRISIFKTVAPVTATVGQDVVYTIVISNYGLVTVDNATLVDSNLGEQTSQLPTFTFDPGEEATLSLVHTVTADDLQTYLDSNSPITNVATLNGTFGASEIATAEFVSTQASLAVTVDEALSVSKVASVSEAEFGDVITFTVTVTNNSSLNVDNLELYDPSASVTANLSGLVPDVVTSTTTTYTYTVTTSDVSAGAVTNTVMVTGTLKNGTADFNPVQTDVASSTAVVNIASAPNLVVTKSASPASGSTVAYGDTITYTMTVMNSGETAAMGVQLVDTVPTDFVGVVSNDSALTENGVYTFAVGTLAASATETRTVVVTVTSQNIGMFTNTVTATANNAVSSTASVMHALAGTSALTITKSVDRLQASTLLSQGETLYYTIVVTNTGTSIATNIVVTDVLTTGLTFVSATANGVAGNDNGTVNVSISELASGASETITITVNINSNAVGSTSIPNTAAATATGLTDEVTASIVTYADPSDPTETIKANTTFYLPLINNGSN